MFLGSPHVAGAIDCPKITIVTPREFSDQYIDYKGHFSLNVQMVVNHHDAVTNLSARWPGSVNDLQRESDLH